VEEYKYGAKLGNAFRGKDPIKYLQNIGMSKTYCKCPVSLKFLIETSTKTNSYGQLNISKDVCIVSFKIHIDIYACSDNSFYVSISESPFDRKFSVLSNTSIALIHLHVLQIFFRGTVVFRSQW
jgi:hypothetical protein